MKKNFKLVLALVLSLLLVASSVAFADVSLTVSNPVDGHTYSYFQLFTGDLANHKLSNVKWGADVASSITYKAKADANATTFTVDTTYSPVAGAEVPQAILDYLASLEGKDTASDSVAQATANIISAWVTGNGTAITSTTKVPTGYYVIKDAYTNPNDPQKTTLSTNIVAVVNDTTIAPKAGTTEHKKEVVDVNDTTETALDLTNLYGIDAAKWSTSADYDFGDKVPFKLTTTIGSDFAKYTSYYLSVNDTLGAGLKLDQDSIKVYVDGELATKGTADGNYSVTVNGQTFKVEFTKLNGNAKAAAGKDVVVVYTATLDKDSAVIGNPGNPNESYAEFSNNPNDAQGGKGKTPTDTVVVFTYKTDVDKIDSNGAALGNAGFTLYKKYKAEVSGKTNVAGTTPAGAKATTFPSGEYWYEVGTIAATSAGTNFEFKGIDDGTYILVESTTPDGYNTMDPITITVTATHGEDSNSTTGYSISVLSTDNNNFKADPKGGEIKFTKKNGTDKTLVSGEIYSEIINNEGTTLPATGGIGTTIFYIGGSILVLAAAILLITKRRMSNND